MKKTEKIRLRVNLPITLKEKVQRISEKTGIPCASLVSMMIADTLLNRKIDKVEKDYRRKKDKRTKNVNEDLGNNRGVILITFDNDYYKNVIIKLLETEEGYTITDLAIDCIELQINQFDYILFETLELTKCKKIRTSKINKEGNSSKKEYKLNAPLDDYIKNKADTFGVSKEVIKNYYLSKQINVILGAYKEEKMIYSDPERYNGI